MPPGAWQNLCTDFCGSCDTREYNLTVIINEYSRFLVLQIVKSVLANSIIPVIPMLDKILSFNCVQLVSKTDYGSPFISTQFSNYTNQMGFKFRKMIKSVVAMSKCSTWIIQQIAYEKHHIRKN